MNNLRLKRLITQLLKESIKGEVRYKGKTYSKEEIKDMRDWLKDVQWADLDSEEVDDLSDEEVLQGVNINYEGGLKNFRHNNNLSESKEVEVEVPEFVETKIKQSLSQLDRWEANGKELKQNYRNKVGKKILQIEAKTLTPLEIFPSIIEAKEQTQINGIRNCAAGLQKTAGGYIWVYKHPENPYFEYIINENEIIRVFENNYSGNEELWHRDDEDRIVEIIGKTDWKIQLENQLPTSMNQPIFIPRHEWHRTIKGTGNLKLKIYKS